MKSDSMNLSGAYDIEARDAGSGAVVGRWHLHNTLTTINQTVRTQMLLGTYTGALDALQIKYFAFGTGSTPATAADTQLASEYYRKQVTQISSSASGVVNSTCALTASEVNTEIREIGVFCGSGATSTANSGTLLSRIVVDIVKTQNILLNIIRTDTCAI